MEWRRWCFQLSVHGGPCTGPVLVPPTGCQPHLTLLYRTKPLFYRSWPQHPPPRHNKACSTRILLYSFPLPLPATWQQAGGWHSTSMPSCLTLSLLLKYHVDKIIIGTKWWNKKLIFMFVSQTFLNLNLGWAVPYETTQIRSRCYHQQRRQWDARI